jgi:hypothetical protein
VFQKVPVNKPPPGSPLGGRFLFTDISFTYLEFLIKVLLIKRNFTLLLKALRKGSPPIYPKMGPPWKQMPISRALLNISFGVPQ